MSGMSIQVKSSSLDQGPKLLRSQSQIHGRPSYLKMVITSGHVVTNVCQFKQLEKNSQTTGDLCVVNRIQV